MPSIAAGSYPVENVPTVSPQAPSGDFQRIEANPEAFGAGIGAAEQGLGQKIGQFADMLSRQGLERQDLYNNTTADQQTNSFIDKALKIQHGDPNTPGDTGFFGKTGQAAMDAYPAAVDAIRSSRLDLANSLNPIARLKYENDTRRQMAYMLGSMGTHYDSQMKSWQNETSKGQYNLGGQQVQSAAITGDEGQIVAGLAAQYRAIDNMPGLSDEDKQAKKNEAHAAAIEAQVMAAAPHDPTRAMQILEDNKASIVDKDRYDRLYNGLKQANTKAWSDYYAGQGPKPETSTVKPVTPRALIPYTPSTDLLSGVGISAEQYNTYRSYLASREAASYAQPPNPGGYMGQYQMGQDEIAGAAQRLGVPVPSKEEFLSNPGLQEKLFDNYTLNNHNLLMEKSDKYRSATPQERAAILAGAHIGGVGGDESGKGVIAYIDKGIDHKDSNGTSIGDYVTSMRHAQQNASLPTPLSSPSNVEVWGDSLGVGLKTALGAQGTAVSGLLPKTILENIKAQPAASWQGKTIVLSSGSNAEQMPVVEETIKYLKDNGANPIVVGYGSKGQLPQRNAALHEIAGRLQVPVVDAEGVGGDGVHPGPAGYNSMAQKINGLAAPKPADQNVTPTVAPSAAVTPAIAGATSKGFSIAPPDPNNGEIADTDVPGLPDAIGKAVDNIIKDGEAQGKTHYDMQNMIDLTIKKIRAEHNAQYREQSQQAAIEKAKKKAASDAIEERLAPNVYSGSPNLPTEKQIMDLVPQGLSPERANEWVKNVRAAMKEEKVVPNDASNFMDLDKKLFLPYGNPDKILDRGPIDQAYQNGQISASNRDKLTKELDSHKTDLGVKLSESRQSALSNYDLQVRGRKDALGQYIDSDSGDRAYKFRDWLLSQEGALQKANKDPMSLYDSNSPNFFAKDGIPDRFKQSRLMKPAATTEPPKEYNPDGTAKGQWDNTELPLPDRIKALREFAQQSPENYQMAQRIKARYKFGAQAPEAK